MTTPSTARKAGPFTGNGSTTAFPFTFKVFAAGDVKVAVADSDGVETVLVLDTHYTVALNGNQETSPGGTITYPVSGSPLPVGSVLSAIGDLDYDQTLDIPGAGNFNPVTLENQLDRATMQIQQLKEQVDRSAKLPQTSAEDAASLVADIVRLADSADNLDTVAGAIANVNTVATNISSVNTVATNAGAVAATSANIAAVVAVGNDLLEPVSEINTVAGAIDNVNAAGSNIANVNTVAGVAADVTTVAGIATDVATVADNVADVTNFADVYQGPKASDPTLRNNGNALQVGDLYFNTTNKRMRVFGGSTWQESNAGAISVQNFSGDGAETEFALTVAPQAEENTQVYISGVYQQKNRYEIVDTALTFSDAPPAGTGNIEVVTMSVLPLGVTDATLVEYMPAGSGAVATDVQTQLRNIQSWGTNVKDAPFYAVGDGIADDTAAIQAAIDSPAKRIYLPAGTYSATTLDLRGKYVTFYGDGIDATIIKARSVTTALLNANESSDVRISPLLVEGMTIDANFLADSALDIRYRHITDFENVRIINGVEQCVKAKDTWLMRMAQCEVEGAPVGLWLVGSNHRSKFDSVSFQGCTAWHIKAESAGTALDGNSALEFSNCDVESGPGGGVYLNVSDAAFRSCYLGENIDGAVISVQSGNIEFDGGVLYFGHTTNSFGIDADGGKTLFRKATIAGQESGGWENLLSGSATNAVRFEDCSGNTTVGGDQVVAGNLIDYGPQGVVYCDRLGKNFTGSSNDTTFSSVLSGNSKTFTVLTVTGATPLLGCYSTLVGKDKWRDGENAYLVVVYASSQYLLAKLSGSVMGGGPSTTIGVLPPTSGVTKTYIKIDASLDNAAYTVLEFITATAVVGEQITLHECYLADSRTLNKGSSAWGNLFKC